MGIEIMFSEQTIAAFLLGCFIWAGGWMLLKGLKNEW